MTLTPDSRPLRIFLVEDHADTRKFLAMQLKRMGYLVETAGSVTEAADTLSHSDCDLLLSDIGLPDGDGWSLLGSLRKMEHPPFIVAIAMSGYGTDDDLAKSSAVGFRHHIVKPFKISDLEPLLEEAELEIVTRE